MKKESTIRKWYMEYRRFEARKKPDFNLWPWEAQLQALPNIRVGDIASCQDNKVISLIKGRSQKLNIGCKVVKSTFVWAQGCTSVC
jgi:hypothetical protein